MPMWLLKILLITILAVGGVIAAAALALNVIPGERFKPLISYAVHSTTGRNLSIDGDLSIDLSSTLTFSASDIHFSNSRWGSRPDMFSGRRIQGRLALAPLLQGVLDFSLLLQAPDLLLETNPEGRGNWQLGGAEVSRAPDDEGGLNLRPFIHELRLEQVKIAYLDGSTSETNSATFKTFLLQSRGDQVVVELDGQVDAIPVRISGGVDSAVDSVDGAPTRFNLSGNAGKVELTATGILGALSTMADVDLLIKLEAPTLSAFTPFVGQELPGYGPLKAKIRINGAGGNYTISDLQANLDSKALTLVAKGSIADLAAVAGIDAELSAETPNLPEIVKRLKVDVPAELPSGIKAQATFSGSLEQLTVDRFQVDAQDKGVQASISGSVDNLITLTGIKAKTSLNSDSLASLSRFAGTQLPPLGSVKISAEVVSQDKMYAAKNIDAALSGSAIQATLTGSIGDILAFKAIDTSARVDLNSLASLNSLTGQKLADAGPVAIDVRLVSKGGFSKGSDISGSITGDGIIATVDGHVADLRTMQGIETIIDIKADSLRQLSRQTGVALELDAPFTLQAKARKTASTYQFEDLQAFIGAQKATGTISFTPPAKTKDRPRLDGQLHLGRIDLSMFTRAGGDNVDDSAVKELPEAESVKATGKVSVISLGQTTRKANKIFSADPLPREMLKSVDARLVLSIDEILTNRILMQKLSTKIDLENGRLTIKPIQATVGKGSVQGVIELNAQKSPAVLSGNLALTKGTFRNFGGRYDLKIDVNGKGDSIAALMAGLDGQVILDARDVELKKSLMTDFGRGLLDSLNPFDKEEKTSRLICAIARFDISDGIANADDKLVAQMTKVTWFGGGEIDLKTEKLSLGAQSKPRTGLGLKLFSSVASLVHLGGTLAQPQLQLDPKGVAKKYGEVYLTVATGGLYALAKGLWDKNEANSEVCAKILAMKEGSSKKHWPISPTAIRMPDREATVEQLVKP